MQDEAVLELALAAMALRVATCAGVLVYLERPQSTVQAPHSVSQVIVRLCMASACY